MAGMSHCQKRTVTILGASGSIGTSALKFLRLHQDKFALKYIAVDSDVNAAGSIAAEFGCEAVAINNAQAAAGCIIDSCKVLPGPDGVETLAGFDVDIVLGAVTGSCGLPAILAAIKAGNDIALANKESLVCGGPNLLAFAKSRGVKVIPVDSEHSAIFQCLLGSHRAEVEKIILTASGGPFRNTPLDALTSVSPAQALDHPNWSMGPKNSLDSATLANKGLELIETAYFFDADEADIDVVIHPTSIFHSAVRFTDGAMIAQLGATDMCGAVGYGLSYPDRLATGLLPLDLARLGSLEFYAPDMTRFPSLALARVALKQSQGGSLMFNAANEIAGKAFLDGQIGFMDIPKLIEVCLDQGAGQFTAALEDVVRADEAAKRFAADRLTTML